MTFNVPVECPICAETLAPDRPLETHLVKKHTHREVAHHLVPQQDHRSR